MKIFSKITDNDLKKLFKCINAKDVFIKKGSTFLTNLNNANIFGIIKNGKASIIRVDYNGNRSIIETLEEGDIFESRMFNISNNELSIIALEDCEVIITDYNHIINRCKKNCFYHNQFIDNIQNTIINKLNDNYTRIQLLTKKTIREKLLEYFRFISYKKNSKEFKMPISFTALADYLAVDRSALMREIKNLKDDNVIKIENKKVVIYY